MNEEEHKAEVYLRPEEVSLAIGKGGLNIKLACMLTEYAIDVFRDVEGADEEDIYLDEFSDEIDSWVIEALKNIGCYTAKSVLNVPTSKNRLLTRYLLSYLPNLKKKRENLKNKYYDKV